MRKSCFLLCALFSLAYVADADSVRFFNGETSEGRIEVGPKGLALVQKGSAPAPVNLADVLSISLRKNPHTPELLPGIVLVNGTAIADREREKTVTSAL